MIAVALDPGVTTGYAVGSIDDGLMTVVTGEYRWSHIDLHQFLAETKPRHIIIERFEFRQGNPKSYRKGLELYSRELIGVVQLYAQLLNNNRFAMEETEIVLQNPMKEPTKGKPSNTYFTNARLKEAGIYKTGTGGHCNDAARHLLYWFHFGAGFKYNTKGYKTGVFS